MFKYLFVDQAVPAMWRSLAAARLRAELPIGKRVNHARASPDLTQQALERIVNRYEDVGAAVPAAVGFMVAYGATIRGEGHREHEGAGRPICTMSCELAFVSWPPLRLARLR